MKMVVTKFIHCVTKHSKRMSNSDYKIISFLKSPDKSFE